MFWGSESKVASIIRSGLEGTQNICLVEQKMNTEKVRNICELNIWWNIWKLTLIKTSQMPQCDFKSSRAHNFEDTFEIPFWVKTFEMYPIMWICICRYLRRLLKTDTGEKSHKSDNVTLIPLGQTILGHIWRKKTEQWKINCKGNTKVFSWSVCKTEEAEKRYIWLKVSISSQSGKVFTDPKQ